MKLLKFILVFFLVFSCKNERTSVRTVTSELDSSQNNPIKHQKPLVSEVNFEVEKFIDSANSLLSRIKRKPIKLTYKIDTIKDTLGFMKELYQEGGLLKAYSFDLGKGDRELNFKFIDAEYNDSISTTRAFMKLQDEAYNTNNSTLYPGLTYTNDYVIKTKENIYWLNTGCPYAYYNHLKLKEYVLNSLPIERINDSIHCKCGQVICTKSD